MSLALKINPIEVPELLSNIGYHLSIRDQKACMLVSRNWYVLFRAYYWDSFIYNRIGLANIEKYGSLVRRLQTFWLDEEDIFTIAGSFHRVQQLRLEYCNTVPGRVLENMFGNMPIIHDLTIHFEVHINPFHLSYLTRLRHLRILSIESPFISEKKATDIRSCNVLLNVIQQCPNLISLSLTCSKEYWSNRSWRSVKNQTPPPPPRPTRAERFARLFNRSEPWRKFNVGPIPVPVAEPEKKEQWRKFDTTKAPDVIADHLYDNPSLSEHYSKLTTLHVNTAWEKNSKELKALFLKSPYIKELYIDFERVNTFVTADCLRAIGKTCRSIQTLSISGLNFFPRYPADSFIYPKPTNELMATQELFRMHHPELRYLKLKDCKDIDHVLSLIPKKTIERLERVVFDSTIYSHKEFHKFMTRASSLQYMTWITTFAMKKEPPPENERLDAYVGPWACSDTLRHLEQESCVNDDGSCEVLLDRISKMSRLVSLTLSALDIRRCIDIHSRGGIDQIEDRDKKNNSKYIIRRDINEISNDYISSLRISNEGADHPSDLSEKVHYQESPPEYTSISSEVVIDEKGIEIENGFIFGSVQELTIGSLKNQLPGYRAGVDIQKKIDTTELKSILAMFPKLRVLRYKSGTFPLDDEAYTYLQNQHFPKVSIFHVTQ